MLKRWSGPLFALFIGTMIWSGCGSGSDKKASSIFGEAPDNCSTPPSWNKADRTKVKRINRFFQKRHRAGRFNGTVLFAEKGRILHKKSYGYRERREGDSLTPQDPFQLASISKTLTSTLILQLVETGELALKDSLSQYFEGWPYQGITLKMLLNHRSGLANYMYFMEGWDKDETYDNEDVLRKIKKDTPDVYYVPDHRYNYCNTNYCLLALIAERSLDTNFRTAIMQKIYKPSGMEDPEALCSLEPEKAVVKGHNKWGTPIHRYPNRVMGDKGLYASAMDLYRFDQTLRKGKLLPDSILEKAYTPQHEDLYDYDNYGLGWRINESDPKNRIVWHNGWWKGFRTYFVRVLDRNATIVVLNNTTTGPFLSKEKLIQLLYPEFQASI